MAILIIILSFLFICGMLYLDSWASRESKKSYIYEYKKGLLKECLRKPQLISIQSEFMNYHLKVEVIEENDTKVINGMCGPFRILK